MAEADDRVTEKLAKTQGATERGGGAPHAPQGPPVHWLSPAAPRDSLRAALQSLGAQLQIGAPTTPKVPARMGWVGEAPVLRGLRPDLAESRLALLHTDAGGIDGFAQALRAVGAEVALASDSDASLERLQLLLPTALIVEADDLGDYTWKVLQGIWQHPVLRWTPVLISPLERYGSGGMHAPELEHLAHALELTDRRAERIVAAVEVGQPVHEALTSLGPALLLRALADAEIGARVTLETATLIVDVDVAEGIVAGAEARSIGGRDDTSAQTLGRHALGLFLRASEGQLRIRQVERPAWTNVMAPLDVASRDALGSVSRFPGPTADGGKAPGDLQRRSLLDDEDDEPTSVIEISEELIAMRTSVAGGPGAAAGGSPAEPSKRERDDTEVVALPPAHMEVEPLPIAAPATKNAPLPANPAAPPAPLGLPALGAALPDPDGHTEPSPPPGGDAVAEPPLPAQPLPDVSAAIPLAAVSTPSAEAEHDTDTHKSGDADSADTDTDSADSDAVDAELDALDQDMGLDDIDIDAGELDTDTTDATDGLPSMEVQADSDSTEIVSGWSPPTRRKGGRLRWLSAAVLVAGVTSLAAWWSRDLLQPAATGGAVVGSSAPAAHSAPSANHPPLDLTPERADTEGLEAREADAGVATPADAAADATAAVTADATADATAADAASAPTGDAAATGDAPTEPAPGAPADTPPGAGTDTGTAGIEPAGSNEDGPEEERPSSKTGSASERRARAKPFIKEGRALYTRGKLSEAEAAYLKALTIVSPYPRAMEGLAKVYAKQGKEEQARDMAKKLVEIRPGRSSYHLLLGDTLAALGQTAEAKQAWEHAAERGNDKAKQRLAK